MHMEMKLCIGILNFHLVLKDHLSIAIARLSHTEHYHIVVSPLWCCEWLQLYVSKDVAQYMDHCFSNCGQ